MKLLICNEYGGSSVFLAQYWHSAAKGKPCAIVTGSISFINNANANNK